MLTRQRPTTRVAAALVALASAVLALTVLAPASTAVPRTATTAVRAVPPPPPAPTANAARNAVNAGNRPGALKHALRPVVDQMFSWRGRGYRFGGVKRCPSVGAGRYGCVVPLLRSGDRVGTARLVVGGSGSGKVASFSATTS
jgi:hypothetical protein